MCARRLTIDQPYLHLPVQLGAEVQTLALSVEGETIRRFTMELPCGERDHIDFWVFCDVSDYIGQSLTIAVEDGGDARLDMIAASARRVDDPELYQERYRPRFHYTAQRGWLNDPNGMLYLDGEYHLFYQHNPYGIKWGNMHWGHAVSRDLVHWEELPIALYPDEIGMIFSGSAVVDRHNTSGLFPDQSDGIVAYYTYRTELDEQFQAFAISRDRGRSWTKHKEHLLYSRSGRANSHFRDPKLLWHEETRQWVMAIYEMMADEQKTIAFYTSDDLIHWTYRSQISGYYECPDLLCMPVEGEMTERRWVLLGGNGAYCIGDFDGQTFMPETETYLLDYGRHFYATQTFNELPEQDGRFIQMAWMRRSPFPDMPFSQQMTVPCELTLRQTDEGLRLAKQPASELRALRGRHAQLIRADVDAASGELLTGELIELAASTFEWDIRLQGVTEGLIHLTLHGAELVYDASAHRIAFMETSLAVELPSADIRIQVLRDVTSIELFINDGYVCLSNGHIADVVQAPLSLYLSRGSAAKVIVDGWELAQ